jgi:hypothetical protein
MPVSEVAAAPQSTAVHMNDDAGLHQPMWKGEVVVLDHVLKFMTLATVMVSGVAIYAAFTPTIGVWELISSSNIPTGFPTCGEACQRLHCSNGTCLATPR